MCLSTAVVVIIVRLLIAHRGHMHMILGGY